MKKIISVFVSAAALFAVCSCNPSLQSTYEQYLGDGETIYVGKLTDIEIFPGLNRFILSGKTHYMNTAKQVVITLLDTDIQAKVDVDPSVEDFSYSFENVPAGNYYVEVESVDKDGNKSLAETHNVNVYGKESAVNYYAKRVATASFTALAGTMALFFNSVDEATSLKLTYTKEDGTVETVELAGDVSEYQLKSWKDQSEVKVYTRIRPYANAIDELEMEPTSFKLPSIPEEMELPRAYWAWPECTSDTWATNYGGKIPTLWDGRYGGANNGFHTGPNQGVPGHITIDVGIRACLTRGRIMFRPNGNWMQWPAKHFEIWGHADGNTEDFLEIEDNYTTPEGQFEKESIEKGWVKLADYFPEETKLAGFQFIDFPVDSDYENIRYIRYRFVSGFQSNSTADTTGPDGGYVGKGCYSMATEIWFWGKTTKLLYLEEEAEN